MQLFKTHTRNIELKNTHLENNPLHGFINKTYVWNITVI